MALHDWEVQATYRNNKKRYGRIDTALDKMREYYEFWATEMNLHLVFGNMQKRPWQFIIIGVLRTFADVDNVKAQGSLL